MNGLRTRKLLNDYAMQERLIFLRPNLWTRVRRFLRRITFGMLK